MPRVKQYKSKVQSLFGMNNFRSFYKLNFGLEFFVRQTLVTIILGEQLNKQ